MKQNDLLTKLLLLCLMVVGSASSAWADDEPTLAIGTTAQTTSSFLGEYATEGITLSSSASYSSGAVQIGNTPSAYDQHYFEVLASSAAIKKVSFLISGNGSNKSIQAPVFGWEEIANSNTAATYRILDPVTVTANSYTAAQWFEYDLSTSDVKCLRIYRTTKNISSTNPEYTGSSTALGSGQTIKIYGIKVWLKDSGPAKAYTVTAASNNDSYGTASAAASSLDKGETTTVTATPKTGYEFTSWSVEGEGSTLSSTTANPTTLTMGTANTTVTATFSAINYAITHNPATGGTYTISVAGGEATSESTTATIGQTITLAGTPADPAKPYIRWNVKDAEDANVTVINNQFTMPAKAVTISPVFSKPLNTLFSMTNITAITNDTGKSKYGTVTATISDGSSVDVFNNKGDANELLYGSSINLNGSGSNYIHITFPTKLVEGDEISATFLADNQDWKISKTTSGAAAKTNPYTLTENDALIGATELYIFKNNSAQVTELYVKGEGQISDLEVTSSTTPTVAIGLTSAITTSTSSTGEITYSSSDTDVATVSDAGVITAVGGGTATITISQAADATYRPGSATVTVTVPETALLKIITSGGTSTKNTGTATFTADVNLSNNRKMDTGKYVGFTFTGDYSLQTGDVVEVDITTAGQKGTFKFYDSKGDDPTLLYDTEVAPSEAKTYRFVMPAEMNGVKTVYLRRGADKSGINEGFNPYFGYIAVYRPDALINLNASGFATYSAGSDFIYAGADAYRMVLDLGEGTLTGAKIDDGTKIPAGAGILFKGEANGKIAIVNTNGATSIGDNSLKGTTDAEGNLVAKSGSNTFYALSGNHFKPYTGASFAANKAYFEVGPGEARNFTMTFEDGETTSIAGIETKQNMENMKFYNLNGQQVEAPTKGLYIVNGRKVVIK